MDVYCEDATFEQLCLPRHILQGVKRAGYTKPSPVQVIICTAYLEDCESKYIIDMNLCHVTHDLSALLFRWRPSLSVVVEQVINISNVCCVWRQCSCIASMS